MKRAPQSSRVLVGSGILSRNCFLHSFPSSLLPPHPFNPLLLLYLSSNRRNSFCLSSPLAEPRWCQKMHNSGDIQDSIVWNGCEMADCDLSSLCFLLLLLDESAHTHTRTHAQILCMPVCLVSRPKRSSHCTNAY